MSSELKTDDITATHDPSGQAHRSVAHAMIAALKSRGLERAFCVPGESYLPLLVALADDQQIELVTCRHEGGAAIMAEATARLSGKPGLCLVTRAPGAMNASLGVHVAAQSATPLLLIIGQVATDILGRYAFQEEDLVGIFRPLTKHAEQLIRSDRAVETMLRAWEATTSQRPGPAVMTIPSDLLSSECVDAARPASQTSVSAGAPTWSADIRRELEMAHRPLVLVGGPNWTGRAAEELRSWAEASALPVVVDFRRQDYCDNTSSSYVGYVGTTADPRLMTRFRNADVVLSLGSDLNDMSTDRYRAILSDRQDQRLIHVGPTLERQAGIFAPAVHIVAHATDVVADLHAAPAVTGAWASWTKDARNEFIQWHTPPANDALAESVAQMNTLAPAETIVTTGAGNYTAWVQRFWTFRMYQTQLAPPSGAMGYGLPAAIAAALQYPERQVLCFAGDGCFQMTGQELATAAEHHCRIIIVIVDNGMFGTIRMHQERYFPGQSSNTILANPDFAALAEAYGAHGFATNDTEGLLTAFSDALENRRLSVIHMHADPARILPGLSLLPEGGLRES